MKLKNVKPSPKPKVSIKKEDTVEEIEVIETEINEVVENITKEMETVCIDRASLVKAILLALFSRSHLLIEGEPGTAKSYVVRKFMEHLAPDVKQFKILLTKDTVADAVIGPVHLGALREESIFRYNTVNMLPEANIAMLEEVYRARGTVLDSTLTILNERVFMNAGVEIECPLCSAFGTTNFVSKDSEGEAFLDRWAIHYKVGPLASEHREKLFKIPVRETSVLTKLSLNRINEVADTKVILPGAARDFYLELIAALESAKSAFSRKITDRRILDTMRLIKAEALINGRTTIKIEDVYAARYGLTLVGDPQEDSEFDKLYENLSKKYTNIAAETKEYETEQNIVAQWLVKAQAQLKLGATDSNGSVRTAYKSVFDLGNDIHQRLDGPPDVNFQPSPSYKNKRDTLLRQVSNTLNQFKF